MENDVIAALKKLGVENVDKIISLLKSKGLLESAWNNRTNLKNFLESYGSFQRVPRFIPGGTKTVTIFSPS